MRHLTLIVLTPLLLAACGKQAGQLPSAALDGAVTQANINRQIAYPDPSARLRDLSIAFVAETRDTVNFDFNRATLDSEARRILDGQAAWLKRNREVRMTVTGHADRVGGEGYNDRLGLRRAQAVVAYLTRAGVARNRLDAVESRGEREPVVDTQAQERRNRRTVTTVAGFDRLYVGDGIDGNLAAFIYDRYQGRTLGGSESVEEASSTDTGN